MDDHGIHIGNIQPCLNDGGRNQHVDISIDKIVHNPFQFPLAHLSMGKIHPGIWYQLGNPKGNLINVRHPVINIINLTASSQLSSNGLPDSLLIIFHNVSLDRHTIHRRLLQHTHIPDPDHAHMKGSGNRRSCQCENINVLFQLLDLFLMGNAETLLLVYDQKSQVLILHILGKHSVGTDHNVHLSFFQVLERLLLLGRSAETAEQIYPYWKFLHSLDKGIVNLLGQNGSWRQIHHLSALLHLFKGSAEGNLCLAISNISTHQAIHDPGALHVTLGILNGIQLVFRFFIREHFLEFPLPYCIRTAHIPLFFLADGIKLYQLFGNIFDCALYL